MTCLVKQGTRLHEMVLSQARYSLHDIELSQARDTSSWRGA